MIRHLYSLCCCLMLTSCWDNSTPDPLEWDYAALATEGFGYKLCTKIHTDSLGTASFNPLGKQIHFIQSLCYFNLARQEHNPYYCQFVKEAKHWWLNGSDFSPTYCTEMVAKTSQAGFGHIGFDKKRVLQAAGYNEEDMKHYLHPNDLAHPLEAMRWNALYYALREKSASELTKRIEKLPDFNTQ